MTTHNTINRRGGWCRDWSREYLKTSPQPSFSMYDCHPRILRIANSCQTIQPSEDTIIYLYVLNALLDTHIPASRSSPKPLPPALLPEGELWTPITRILIAFDPIQARYAGESLRRVVQIVAHGAEQTRNPVPAIQLLPNAILRLDPSSSTLTTTHFLFIRVCLLARAYADAVTILDLPIYSIAGDIQRSSAGRTFKYLCASHDSSSIYLNPSTGLSGRLSSKQYLEYHLLAAMCYMALRQYERALFFLEVVLTGPTASNVVSRVMLEAYKKWVLLGLLIHGELSNVPKAISPANLKTLRSLAKPYECVVEAFKSGNIEQMKGEMQIAQDWWIDDSNNGLIIEVFNAFRKFAVLRLSKTFTALSITEVARRTSPNPSDLNETVHYITTLIQSGSLNAQLVTPPTEPTAIPTLRFSMSTPNRSEAEIAKALAVKTTQLQHLMRYVAENEHKLEINREYVDFLKKLKKTKDQEKIAAGPGGPVSGANSRVMDIDEEIMGDY